MQDRWAGARGRAVWGAGVGAVWGAAWGAVWGALEVLVRLTAEC